jgi:hypothetical protein
MCGRFVGYRSKEELLDLFPIDSCETEVVANYNIAPTQSYDHYRTGQPPSVKAGQCGSQQQFVQHQTHEADGVEALSHKLLAEICLQLLAFSYPWTLGTLNPLVRYFTTLSRCVSFSFFHIILISTMGRFDLSRFSFSAAATHE